jgi:hypothetical protein
MEKQGEDSAPLWRVLRGGWALVGGIALPFAGFIVFNLALFHAPLGLHSRQVLDGFSWAGQLRHAAAMLWAMGRDLLRFEPVLWFVLVGLAWSAGRGLTGRVRRAPASAGSVMPAAAPAGSVVPATAPAALEIEPEADRLHLTALVGIIVLVALGTAFIVPNAGSKQWGPRFLLFDAPLIALAAGLVLKQLARASSRPALLAGLAVFAICAAAGANLNVRGGMHNLRADYRDRIRPVLESLRALDPQVVAVQNMHIAQELEAAFVDKRFFHPPSPDRLVDLARAARANDQPELLYIRFKAEGEVEERLEFSREGDTLRCALERRHRRHHLYRCALERGDRP